MKSIGMPCLHFIQKDSGMAFGQAVPAWFPQPD